MATMLCFQVRSPIVCARFFMPNVASLQVKRKSLEQANISAQHHGAGDRRQSMTTSKTKPQVASGTLPPVVLPPDSENQSEGK